MAEDIRQENERTKKQKNQSFVFLCLSVLCLFVLCPLRVFADKVYLKDGKSYEGKLIGKSDKRFLFSINVDGEKFQMSFFPSDIEKIELSKDTVEEQIPYLKDVDSFRIEVKEDLPKIFELSLYKESQGHAPDATQFTENELKATLNKQEKEYYQKFNDILKRYVDKFQAVQNLYVNLTTATRDDFAQAKEYMDELYFELDNIYVPEAFKKSHTAYLESVKASFLAFGALEKGLLDEAAKQTKISEDARQRSMTEFRQVIVARHPAAYRSRKDASAAVQK